MSNSVHVNFNDISVEIKQDQNGLFSLNDLHLASGGSAKHRPSYFIGLDVTIKFISVLNAVIPAVNSVSVKEGRGGGTWVCKDLVYDYAAWISPEFKLKIYRTFEAVASANLVQAQLAANRIVIPQALIDETRALDLTLPAIIKHWNENQPKVRGPQVYALVRRELLQRPTAGLTTADIKKESSHETYFDWMLEKCPEAIGVYNATLKMLLPLLKHGVDYYAIRDTLQGRT